jgi:hypothetical protein
MTSGRTLEGLTDLPWDKDGGLNGRKESLKKTTGRREEENHSKSRRPSMITTHSGLLSCGGEGKTKEGGKRTRRGDE